MCGIAGVFNIEGKAIEKLEESLVLMNNIQKHRGPDGEGFFTSSKRNLGFAHARLSIIDLQLGNQPMSDAFGNTIVFNGQIYNAPELRKEIGSAYNFKTRNSDTEVILACYKLWGEKLLEKLEGMFAFMIFEEKTGNVFFARDQIGIKPFYYITVGNNFFFASEAKTLLPFLPSVEVDEEGLKDYLTFQYYTFNKTLFKGVKILEAGFCGNLIEGRLNIKKYFDISFDKKIKITEEEATEELERLMLASVKKHLLSDVPVTSYISGGIDSTTIASMAARQQGITEGYCGFFPGHPEFSEEILAQSVAENANIKLNIIPISEEDYINNLLKIHFYLDTPMVGYGLVNNYKMAQEVSRKYKVVFSGSGGDEIFCGYTRYLVCSLAASLKNAVAGGDCKGLEEILPSLAGLKKYTSTLNTLLQKDIFSLTEDKMFFELIGRMSFAGVRASSFANEDYSSFESFIKIWNQNPNSSLLEKMSYFEQKTFLPALLLMEDKISMVHGLEARTPIIDKTIFNFASTLPEEIKFKNGDLKHLLKQVAKKYLPYKVYNIQDKTGFASPMNLWIKKGKMRDFVTDTLTSQKAKTRKYFNYEIALQNFEASSTFDRTLWGMLALELWHINFIDK